MASGELLAKCVLAVEDLLGPGPQKATSAVSCPLNLDQATGAQLHARVDHNAMAAVITTD